MAREDFEQLSVRFPVGTRDRLAALAKPDETQVAVLLRALDALEQQGSEPTATAIYSPVAEMDDIDGRLARVGNELGKTLERLTARFSNPYRHVHHERQ